MGEKIKTNGQVRHKNYYDQRRIERTVTYDEKWRKFSQDYRKKNPFCVECLKLGNHNIHNIQVDHIIPLEQRPDLKYDVDNLQSLCRSHHGKKTWAEKLKDNE